MEKENLRPEDLMVGDWFRFRYTIDGKEIVHTFRISRIENELGDYYVWGERSGELGRMCKPERLEPIPLTQEILEKNGFEKLDFSHFQIGDRRLVLDADGRWDGPLSWHWVVTEMDTNAKGQPVVLDYYVATINYVHECQRALRCVGLFELANNFKI